MLPFRLAIGLLALAGVVAALVSDWFVDALDPAVEALGISKAFTGLVIVAIAGNAVENVVAVQLARKGQNDLAISVVKNSVAQIACFLCPSLVLVSLFFEDRLTFVLEPVYLGALALTAIAALADHRRRQGVRCSRGSRSSASTSSSRRSCGSSRSARAPRRYRPTSRRSRRPRLASARATRLGRGDPSSSPA